MDKNITILEVVDNRNNEIFRIGDKTTNGVIAEFEADCIKMTNGKRFTYACTLRADGKKITSESDNKALHLRGVSNSLCKKCNKYPVADGANGLCDRCLAVAYYSK